jgi:hypothetical protein
LAKKPRVSRATVAEWRAYPITAAARGPDYGWQRFYQPVAEVGLVEKI